MAMEHSKLTGSQRPRSGRWPFIINILYAASQKCMLWETEEARVLYYKVIGTLVLSRRKYLCIQSKTLYTLFNSGVKMIRKLIWLICNCINSSIK